MNADEIRFIVFVMLYILRI